MADADGPKIRPADPSKSISSTSSPATIPAWMMPSPFRACPAREGYWVRSARRLAGILFGSLPKPSRARRLSAPPAIWTGSSGKDGRVPLLGTTPLIASSEDKLEGLRVIGLMTWITAHSHDTIRPVRGRRDRPVSGSPTHAHCQFRARQLCRLPVSRESSRAEPWWPICVGRSHGIDSVEPSGWCRASSSARARLFGARALSGRWPSADPIVPWAPEKEQAV